MRWFVGNLPFKSANGADLSEKDVAEFLEDRGAKVIDVKFIRDRNTRDFVGFGFAEVDCPLDPRDESGPFFGQEMAGRVLRIEIAKGPRPDGFAGPDPARRERARAARQRSHEGASY